MIPVADFDRASHWRELDPVWTRLPLQWEEAPFIGNGLVGCLIYGDEKNEELILNLGRSDVGRLDYPGKFMDPMRIQLGALRLRTGPMNIEACGARIDLWNGEAHGHLSGRDGEVHWRAFAPRHGGCLVFEFTGTHLPEWQIEAGRDMVATSPNEGHRVVADAHHHPRSPEPSGGHAIAWRWLKPDQGHHWLIVAIGSSPITRSIWNRADDGCSALDEARRDLDRFTSCSLEGHVNDHRTWWQDFLDQSFFSISDRELESFYAIQLYKWGSTARADGPMVDNHGVWSTEPAYGFATWDYNVQATYRFAMVANHADTCEPLIRFLEDNFCQNELRDTKTGQRIAGLRQQTFLRALNFDPECFEHDEKTPADGSAKLLWGCHTAVEYLERSGQLHRIAPLLPVIEAGLNAMRRHMTMEGNTLHLPSGGSWEAWKGKDPSGLLDIFRWASRFLLKHAEDQPGLCHDLQRVRQDLDILAPSPVGAEGRLLGDSKPPVPHRHWTHLLGLFPLDIADLQDGEEKELWEKSVLHWARLSAGLGEGEAQAFAPVAAMILMAWLGQSEHLPRLADHYLHQRCGRGPGVWPNTFYREYGPVIETPLLFANALQECCLQSRQDGIHLFPAYPDDWGDVIFDRWLVHGGVEVSAQRLAGQTRWVLLRSNRHLSIRLHGIEGLDNMASQGECELRALDSHSVKLNFKEQASILLFRESPPRCFGPVSHQENTPTNPFGCHSRFFARRPWMVSPGPSLLRCQGIEISPLRPAP